MAHVWQTLMDTFWSTKIWFPDGYSWKDLENVSPDVYYPQVRDINWSFVVAVCLLVVRFMYERCIITPIANYLGIKDIKRTVPTNPVLEKEYSKTKRKPTHEEVKVLSKKTELSIREIERWYHKRARLNVPTSMVKFREVSWHFLFYSASFLYGISILWHRQWFWEIRYCVIGWPKQHVDNDIYVFYIAELGFYWSLLLSSMRDVKRKDFKEQITHHLLTISLIYMSWALNYTRYGVIIMVLHDVADIWLSAGKMANYNKRETLCDVLFGFFIVVWLISRIGLFPFWVIRFIIFDHNLYVPATGVTHKMFVSLLCGLQILHVFWTYLIFRIVYRKLCKGSVQDVRSDSEDDDVDDEEDESEDETSQSAKMNGHPRTSGGR